MNTIIRITVFCSMLFYFSIFIKGQENNAIFWKGRVINGDTGIPIPNAVIAVYSKTALYSTDIDGLANIQLDENDSVRVVILGYTSEIYRIKLLRPDSTGYTNLKVYPVSYLIKEITIKGHKGLLDPTIFPKLKEDESEINMHLGNIGSKISDLPPNERFIMNDPPVLEALMHPATYIYAKFSKEQKSIRKLHNAKYQESIERRLSDYINPESIALITGYEGEKLKKFIIYCNANLKIHYNDTGASITLQIKNIFEEYKKSE